MVLVEGVLTRLGESTVNLKNKYVEYSLIQIGDKTLTEVMVDRKLNNFLNDGLATTQPTRLWFIGRKIIMAVQVGNGTRYYGKVNPFFYFGVLIYLGLTYGAFQLHWGLGVFMLFLTWLLFVRKLVDYQRIASAGGTKV